MVEFFPVIYEVPSPPRRGHHRPTEQGGNAPFPSLNTTPSSSYHTTPLTPPRHEPKYYNDVHTGLMLPPLVVTHPLPNPHETYFYAETKVLESPRATPRTSYSPAPLVSAPPASLSTTANSSLALIRQLNGGTAAQFCVEQSIRESYERSSTHSASCQSIQKRCRFPHCLKISVSRGLCRGHGGGRRCHVLNCTKSAQSRSTFCWTHGGGKRCEAEGCMRSRKSKRFCVAHLHHETMGATSSSSASSASSATTTIAPLSEAIPGNSKRSWPSSSEMKSTYLPSLGEALSTASRVAPHLPIRCETRSLLNP